MLWHILYWTLTQMCQIIFLLCCVLSTARWRKCSKDSLLPADVSVAVHRKVWTIQKKFNPSQRSAIFWRKIICKYCNKCISSDRIMSNKTSPIRWWVEKAKLLVIVVSWKPTLDDLSIFKINIIGWKARYSIETFKQKYLYCFIQL